MDGETEFGRPFFGAPVEGDGVVGDLFIRSERAVSRFGVRIQDALFVRVLPGMPESPRLEFVVGVFLLAEDDHDHGFDRRVGLDVVLRVGIRPVVDGEGVELSLVHVRHAVFIRPLGGGDGSLEFVVEAVGIGTVGKREKKIRIWY